MVQLLGWLYVVLRFLLPMINLLPPPQILANRSRYIKAMWSVSLWFLVSVIGVSVVLLMGLWGVLEIKQGTLENSLMAARTSSQGQVLDEAETEARVLKQQLARAVSWDNKSGQILPSELMAAVLDRPRGIYLSGLEYMINKDSVAELRVTGVAETRAALIAYEKRLNTAPHFGPVVSPLSNFITSSNAEFTLTLPVATTTNKI